MYIYPDNLSAKATLWLWELREGEAGGKHCGLLLIKGKHHGHQPFYNDKVQSEKFSHGGNNQCDSLTGNGGILGVGNKHPQQYQNSIAQSNGGDNLGECRADADGEGTDGRKNRDGQAAP